MPHDVVMLYSLKPAFVRSLKHVERHLIAKGVSADRVTSWALPVGIAAGVALAAATWSRWWLIAVPILTLVRMALNALDGSIARQTGTEHTAGAISNEIVDRIGDGCLIAGAYFLVDHRLVTIALLGSLASEYMSVLGWAVHGNRRFVGMGKPDRATAISVGALVAIFWMPGLAMGVFVVAFGSIITTVLRYREAKPRGIA